MHRSMVPGSSSFLQDTIICHCCVRPDTSSHPWQLPVSLSGVSFASPVFLSSMSVSRLARYLGSAFLVRHHRGYLMSAMWPKTVLCCIWVCDSANTILFLLCGKGQDFISGFPHVNTDNLQCLLEVYSRRRERAERRDGVGGWDEQM